MKAVSNFWGQLKAALSIYFTKEKISTFLKDKVVTLAIKKFFGTAMGGGFKIWLAKYLVEYFYEEFAEPFLMWGLDRLGYVYRKNVEGKILIERKNNAQTGTEYDLSVDDIFNGKLQDKNSLQTDN